MLFCFGRDKLRSVQRRRFQLDQLDRANRVCPSRSSTERPTHRTRAWGVGLLRGSKAKMCPDHSLPSQGLDKNLSLVGSKIRRMAAAVRTADFWSMRPDIRARIATGPHVVHFVEHQIRMDHAEIELALDPPRPPLDRRKRRHPILCIHHQPQFGEIGSPKAYRPVIRRIPGSSEAITPGFLRGRSPIPAAFLSSLGSVEGHGSPQSPPSANMPDAKRLGFGVMIRYVIFKQTFTP